MTISLGVFFMAVVSCFSLPGMIFLSQIRLKFNFWERAIFGTVLGFVFFTLISFLGMRTQLFFLPLIFIVVSFLLAPFTKFELPPVTPQSYKKILFILVIFALGVAGQLAIIAPSGLRFNSELVFWSSHGHDGMWHLSLMEEIKRGGQLQNPILAGEKLYNYHFFSDIAPAFFNMYFKLDSLDLYFRLFPLLYSILLGASLFLFVYKITGSFGTGCWAVFFTYFAGSFGYIVTWAQNRTIGGESLFWASQVQSSSGNPPQIAAFVILITIFFLITHYLKNPKNIGLFLAISILLASLIVIKVYAFILVFMALFTAGFWQIYSERRISIFLLLSFGTACGLGLYLPYSKQLGDFLIFEPWWFIRTMVVAPDRLNWLDLELRRQTYLVEHNWKRVVQLELTAFLIFLFGNLGMRFIGFWEFRNLGKIFDDQLFRIFYFSLLSLSFLMPMLFLQKGVAGNTAQFLQYFLLLFGILAAITTNLVLSRVKFPVKILLSLILIATAIPTQLGLIYQFYSRPPLAKISQNELPALDFLRKNTEPDSIIVSPTYDQNLNLNDKIPNIWDWSDSAYISAISTRRSFLADQEQLSIMGYNYSDKLKALTNPFTINNSKIIIYFPKLLRPKIDLTHTSMIKIYDNLDFEIWKKI